MIYHKSNSDRYLHRIEGKIFLLDFNLLLAWERSIIILLEIQKK